MSSSPYEDKTGAGDTTAPGGVANSPTTTTTTTPAPALVSVSGPVAAPGEATWGNGPGLNVRYAGRSAVGLVREHNEDNFVICNLTTGDRGEREASLTDAVGEGGLLFAVCDGMGGAAAGEVASQMAVDVLHEAMRRGGFPNERDVLARRLVSAVEEAGRRIFDAAQKERSRRGMGTTATAAVLIDKVLFVAEVGDSRAYLLRNGQLKQLTKDQSLVNQLIEAGHLTEAEAEAFEHSNIILQALGTSETVQVDLTFVELRRGDRLMLCSDGLSGLVHADTLRDTLAGIDDPAECTGALIRFAEAGGGHDNITVVVIDFDGEALELPRETDSFGYLQYPLVPASSAAGTFSEEEITEASKPLSRSSFDALPPYQPPAGPGVDTNPWLWISAGLAALLIGTWLLAAGDTAGSAATALEPVAPMDRDVDDDRAFSPPPSEAPPSAEPVAAPAEPNAVPVHVYSDVADAVLLVNGEEHGTLTAADGQALDLPPGAYRFEAQSHGNVVAVEVVNVRPDEPVDVYLRLPSGAKEPTKGGAAAADRAAQAPASEAAARAAAATKSPGAAPGQSESVSEGKSPSRAAASSPHVAAGPATASKPAAASKTSPEAQRVAKQPAAPDSQAAVKQAASSTPTTQPAAAAQPAPSAPQATPPIAPVPVVNKAPGPAGSHASKPQAPTKATAPAKPSSGAAATKSTSSAPAKPPAATNVPTNSTTKPAASASPDTTAPAAQPKPESPIPENPF